MKILIAHDGSDYAEAALDDLCRAGLPERAEALVISVAEIGLPPPPPSMYEVVEEARSARSPAELQKLHQRHAAAAEEALAVAERARDRVQLSFPQWRATAEAALGSPASEIVRKADEWEPDLVVVGSHGRSAIGRLVLGSVSQKIVTEARTSVRIARGRIEADLASPRIIIGYDGSAAADGVVQEISQRNWPTGTEIRIIFADEPLTPSLVGNLIPPVREWVDESNREEFDEMRSLVFRAAHVLREAGLTVTPVVREGDPKRILVDEAAEWEADSIFVGSIGIGSRVGRFLLGSISSAVAARAHCSVEVVRTGP